MDIEDYFLNAVTEVTFITVPIEPRAHQRKPRRSHPHDSPIEMPPRNLFISSFKNLV